MITNIEMTEKLDLLRVIVALPRHGGTIQTPSVFCESACGSDDVMAMHGALKFAFVQSVWGEPCRYGLESWQRERGGFP